MSETALFVRHRARPGRRADLERIWERYVRPRVEANADHLTYHFCHDANDPDVVCVFQIYRSAEALHAFLEGDWYPQYLAEVADVVADPPRITPATPVWTK